MAAIMRTDKFMQIFCFQISQMLDRSQIQIMKIFYQENTAKSLLASYHMRYDAVMLKWWTEETFYGLSNCWDKK